MPGTKTVTVMAQGFASELKRVRITRKNPQADFQLNPGKNLRIKFVDNKGNPIPGVFVFIDNWRGSRSLYTYKNSPYVLDAKIPDTSDENGIYEWAWAPADEVFYNFAKDGYQQIRSMSVTATGAEQEIHLLK